MGAQAGRDCTSLGAATAPQSVSPTCLLPRFISRPQASIATSCTPTITTRCHSQHNTSSPDPTYRLIIIVNHKFVLLASAEWPHAQQELADVVAVQGAALCGQAAGQVRISNNGLAVSCLDNLVGLSIANVASCFCSKVYEDAARLHAVDKLGEDQQGSLLAGDEGCADDDVNLLALLRKQLHLQQERDMQEAQQQYR